MQVTPFCLIEGTTIQRLLSFRFGQNLRHVRHAKLLLVKRPKVSPPPCPSFQICDQLAPLKGLGVSNVRWKSCLCFAGLIIIAGRFSPPQEEGSVLVQESTKLCQTNLPCLLARILCDGIFMKRLRRRREDWKYDETHHVGRICVRNIQFLPRNKDPLVSRVAWWLR